MWENLWLPKGIYKKSILLEIELFYDFFRFLRSQKPYHPPKNVADRVQSICNNLKISFANDYQLEKLEEKFKLLDACFLDFQYSVPNSQVHELQSIGKNKISGTIILNCIEE